MKGRGKKSERRITREGDPLADTSYEHAIRKPEPGYLAITVLLVLAVLGALAIVLFLLIENYLSGPTKSPLSKLRYRVARLATDVENGAADSSQRLANIAQPGLIKGRIESCSQSLRLVRRSFDRLKGEADTLVRDIKWIGSYSDVRSLMLRARRVLFGKYPCRVNLQHLLRDHCCFSVHINNMLRVLQRLEYSICPLFHNFKTYFVVCFEREVLR